MASTTKHGSRCVSFVHTLSLAPGISTTRGLCTKKRSSLAMVLGTSRDFGIVSQFQEFGGPIMVPLLSCLHSRCVASTVRLSNLKCYIYAYGHIVISFYSSSIFRNAGYSLDEALYASLGYGAIQVVFTIPTLFLIDTKGRRFLTLLVRSPLL